MICDCSDFKVMTKVSYFPAPVELRCLKCDRVWFSVVYRGTAGVEFSDRLPGPVLGIL